MVRWCWVNFQRRGVLLLRKIVGQWPIACVVGAGGGYLDIFSRLSFRTSVSCSLRDGLVKTEILSERAVKPKRNPNQSNHIFLLISI